MINNAIGRNVITTDGALRGRLESQGEKFSYVETEEGKKRVGTKRLVLWFKGPHPTPVKVSVRKARRQAARDARRANR